MAKYIGIKDNQVKIISDNIFESDDLKIIPLPVELESFSTEDLLLKCVIKNNKIKCLLN
jgi:hypothetical protein